jgi:hypothetical protein
MTLPDPLQCGHPASAAITPDGTPYVPYKTPDDVPVHCGTCPPTAILNPPRGPHDLPLNVIRRLCDVPDRGAS